MPTRQAALATLAGFASLLPPISGIAQQAAPPTQAPAPIVRITPRPRAQTGLPAASGATGTTPSVHRARPSAAAAGATGAQTAALPHKATVPAATAPAATVPHEAAATEHAPPKPSATGLNRNVIVLDPAHGGADSGARIGDNTLEKNVTLAFAFRLRSLLLARGFTVVMTRDSDAALNPTTSATATPSPLTLDDRAGIANHARAAACLLIHATGRGLGVHLYSSEMDPAPAEAALPPWLTAQAAWVPASQALEGQLGSALGRSRIALVSSTASVRPVDSLTCPALVVELAPESDTPGSVNDAGYQERVASALAGALVFWGNAVQAPPKLPPPPREAHTTHHDELDAEPATPEVQP